MGFNRRFPPVEPTKLFDMRYPERVKLLRLAKRATILLVAEEVMLVRHHPDGARSPCSVMRAMGGILGPDWTGQYDRRPARRGREGQRHGQGVPK